MNRWNQANGCAIGSKEDARELNQYIETLRSNIFKVHRDFIEHKLPVSAGGIVDALFEREKKTETLIQLFNYHNQKLKERVGIDVTKGTLTKYTTVLFHLKAFIKFKYKKEDVFLAHLNYQFISEFDHYFKTLTKLQNNTAVKYMGCLKKIIRIGLSYEWIKKDPFIGYKGKLNEVTRSHLNTEELKRLEETEIPNERLAVVRDLFVFSCYTGLAYIDVYQLNRKDIHVGIDGEQWIYKARQKTNVSSKIPLLRAAKDILAKYANYPECAVSGKLLPLRSNQKMNAYLKEISIVCKIDKHLTFHLARHTFATTVTLLNNVPMETVSAMLGHKSLRTTQIYSKVVEEKIGRDMADLKLKIDKKV